MRRRIDPIQILAALCRFEGSGRITTLMIMAVVSGFSATTVSAVALANVMPTILFGVFFGGYIDRFRIKFVWAGAAATTVAGYVCLLYFVWGGIDKFEILGVAVILATCQAVCENCVNWLIGSTTPKGEIGIRNARISSVQAVCGIAAPMALSAAAARTPLLAVGLLMGVAVGSLLAADVLVEDRGQVRVSGLVSKQENRSPWRWIRSNRVVAALLTTVVFNNVAFGMFSAVLPLYAMRMRGIPAHSYGFLSGTMSGLGLLGVLFMRYLYRSEFSARLVTIISLLGQTIGFVGVAGLPSFGGMLVGMGVIGFASSLWNVVSSSILLKTVPEGRRGSVMSFYRGIAFAGAPVGNVLGGVVQSGTPHLSVWACGLVSVVALSVMGVRLNAFPGGTARQEVERNVRADGT